MTLDTFRSFGRSLITPPEDAAAIEPSDSEALPHVTRALYVGGGGSVRLRVLGGGEVTLAGLAAGSLVPIRVVQVFATGTTATALVGLW
jgi:hypothetical protein